MAKWTEYLKSNMFDILEDILSILRFVDNNNSKHIFTSIIISNKHNIYAKRNVRQINCISVKKLAVTRVAIWYLNYLHRPRSMKNKNILISLSAFHNTNIRSWRFAVYQQKQQQSIYLTTQLIFHNTNIRPRWLAIHQQTQYYFQQPRSQYPI